MQIPVAIGFYYATGICNKQPRMASGFQKSEKSLRKPSFLQRHKNAKDEKLVGISPSLSHPFSALENQLSRRTLALPLKALTLSSKASNMKVKVFVNNKERDLYGFTSEAVQPGDGWTFLKTIQVAEDGSDSLIGIDSNWLLRNLKKDELITAEVKVIT